MAHSKATQVFCGNDSRGRYGEYAQRVDGVWFTREYTFNGYGKGLSKWCRSLDQNLNQYIIGDSMDYGFIALRRGEHKGLRLPAV